MHVHALVCERLIHACSYTAQQLSNFVDSVYCTACCRNAAAAALQAQLTSQQAQCASLQRANKALSVEVRQLRQQQSRNGATTAGTGARASSGSSSSSSESSRRATVSSTRHRRVSLPELAAATTTDSTI